MSCTMNCWAGLLPVSSKTGREQWASTADQLQTGPPEARRQATGHFGERSRMAQARSWTTLALASLKERVLGQKTTDCCCCCCCCCCQSRLWQCKTKQHPSFHPSTPLGSPRGTYSSHVRRRITCCKCEFPSLHETRVPELAIIPERPAFFHKGW